MESVSTWSPPLLHSSPQGSSLDRWNVYQHQLLQPLFCQIPPPYPSQNTSALLAAAAKSLQSCPTLRPRRRQPTSLPRPWDSPGKNTGMDCHFLLQCVKVKSESEVIQSCLTLRDPVDCSLPGSSAHGICQARVLEWGAIAFSVWYSIM